MREIADALIAARRKLGLTQLEMARRLKVSQPTISIVERTGLIARSEDLERYAAAYALPIARVTPKRKAAKRT